MARTITTRTPAKASDTQAGAKRLGRPLGSKNKVSSKAKTKTAATPTRRVIAKKMAAPAMPKMSKAELELHVAKLERSIARLRKQNVELKQTARDDAEKPPASGAAPKAKIAAKPKRTVAKARRASARTAETATDPSEHDAAMATDD